MSGSVLFATSYIAANENKLLSYEKLLRMIESGTVLDAVKTLYEVSYADGYTVTGAYDYEKLLFLEEQRLHRFIKDVCPSDDLLRFFMTKNDYHNLKVLLKSKYGKLPLDEELLFAFSSYSLDFLQNCVLNDSYVYLNEKMQAAIKQLDAAALIQKIPPQIIDLLLDKACNQTLLKLAGRIKSKTLFSYLRVQIDLGNLLSVIRLKKLGEEVALQDYFLEGGTFSLKDFTSYYENTNEYLLEQFKYSEYKPYVIKLLEGNFLEFEKMVENALLKLFIDCKRDNFTLQPVIGYYLAKQSELKNVRIILTGLISGIDANVIKERLRDCYVS